MTESVQIVSRDKNDRFGTDSLGRKVYMPQGTLGKAYLIESEVQEIHLRQCLKKRLSLFIAALILALVFFALFAFYAQQHRDHLNHFVLSGLAFPLLLTLGWQIKLALQPHRLAKEMQVVIKEQKDTQAVKENIRQIFIMDVLWLLFCLWQLWGYSRKGDTPMGIIFGILALIAAYSLNRLRKRQKEQNISS